MYNLPTTAAALFAYPRQKTPSAYYIQQASSTLPLSPPSPRLKKCLLAPRPRRNPSRTTAHPVSRVSNFCDTSHLNLFLRKSKEQHDEKPHVLRYNSEKRCEKKERKLKKAFQRHWALWVVPSFRNKTNQKVIRCVYLYRRRASLLVFTPTNAPTTSSINHQPGSANNTPLPPSRSASTQNFPTPPRLV